MSLKSSYKLYALKVSLTSILCSIIFACGSPPKARAPEPKLDKSDMNLSIDDSKEMAPLPTPVPTPIETSKAEAPKKADAVAKPPTNYALLARSNRLDQLRDEASRALAINASDTAALNALAFTFYKKGKIGAARIVIDRGLEKNPNSPLLLTNLAILDIAENEPARALTNLKKSYRLDDHNSETLGLMGSIYIQNREYAKALLPLEQSYKNDKTNFRVANNYAIALTKTKSYEQAQRVYDEIIVQNSRESEVLLNYASLLVDYLNKPKEGLNLVYKVKFIETERQDIIEIANKIELRAKSALK